MNLEANLQSLLDRFKSERYRAPAVRRSYVPKADGRKRPIGIPTFEDKILQRAVLMVLEAVYEQDFLPCSFGFRPGRSPHQALQTLWEKATRIAGGWILEVDVQRFFEGLDHSHLRNFLDQRVRDGVLRRAIDRWLKAGVLENGQWTRSTEGTPQGGVLSPVLANVYLHVVLDEWFEKEVLPRLGGQAFLVRYADDFVIVFTHESDARRVMEVLPKRLGRFGLTVHPEKTRLVRFRRPSRPRDPSGRGSSRPRRNRPGTFDFLGFTHFWAWSGRGKWVIRRKTAKDRFRRAVRNVKLWIRRHRHDPIRDQQRALSRKLHGHYAYYGITGNADALIVFRRRVLQFWRKWLNRRSNRARVSWERFAHLVERYPLPNAVVVHSVYRRTVSP